MQRASKTAAKNYFDQGIQAADDRRMTDVDKAVRTAQLALSELPEDHPDTPKRWDELGNALEARYHERGKTDDLDEAVRAAQQAVDSAPQDPTDYPVLLHHFGNKLQIRYERMGVMADLKESIRAARRAVDLAPKDHAKRAFILNGLGNKLNRRHEETADMEDLEESIRFAREAVSIAPQGSPERANCLNGLGNKLGRRYEHRLEMAYLEEAIHLIRQALDSVPQGDRLWLTCLHNLSGKLEIRYERTKDPDNLEEAIELSRMALDFTPQGDPNHAICHALLAGKLALRYERTKSIADLQAATQAGYKAIEFTPIDHRDRPAYLNNLGNKLESQYEATGDVADLKEAIKFARLAAESVGEDHADGSIYQLNLGFKLENLYSHTKDPRDVQDACDSFTVSWNTVTTRPLYRIKVVARILELLPEVKKFDKAEQMAQEAIDFLPIISGRTLDREDRQFTLSAFSGIAANACGILLEVGKIGQALDCLERGRAVIMGQIIDDRRDVSALKKHDEQLASLYTNLLQAINKPNSSTGSGQVEIKEQLRETRKELEACIDRIRKVPGFERFLLALDISEMQKCAGDGAIVVVNIASFRSDAIIVTSGAIKQLPLPELTAEKAQSLKKWDGKTENRPAATKEYRKYLAWLWKVCVKRVLEETSALLGVAGSNRPPRIWWMGSGPASSMPFHAAGNYSYNSGPHNAFAQAISSYIPSIKALAHSQEQLRGIQHDRGSVLIATMPETPGMGALPEVQQEADAIRKVLDGVQAVEHLHQPSATQVVERLGTCNIAHFACHGIASGADPSKSALVFQRLPESNKAPEQDLLTVHDVSEIQSNSARIAYLSACSTADNQVVPLADEVIHVVSGFQVAGFGHVIGCLWPTPDQVCVNVAEGFYASLFSGGPVWNDDDVASALRESILRILPEWGRSPLKWAQFVHYGA